MRQILAIIFAGILALPEFPRGFWANLAAPFRWRQVVEAAGGRGNSTGVLSR